MKKVLRLSEGDLHRIIKESVNRIIKESVNDDINFNEFLKGFNEIIKVEPTYSYNRFLQEIFYEGESWVTIQGYECHVINNDDEGIILLRDEDGEEVYNPYDSNTPYGIGIGLADTINDYVQEYFS